jgi:hypothetical protein
MCSIWARISFMLDHHGSAMVATLRQPGSRDDRVSRYRYHFTSTTVSFVALLSPAALVAVTTQ